MAMQKDMMGRAVRDSFAKLDPRVQIQNPVMFLVWLSAVMTSVLAVASIFGVQDAGVPTYYVVTIAVILWLTDLFSNFAEALAEGRGKAQADSLRAAKKDVEAHRIESVEDKEHFTVVPGTELTRGDLVIVRAGEQIPGDGDVIEGAASVDESAITGESAPVVREAGGDRSAVTGGTTVLSDWIIVKISSEPGQSFLDKMIAMVEGAARKKTPNEIALEIFLVALSIVFILVTLALYCYSCFSAGLNDMVNPTAVTTLVALLVCLAPTTIGALLSAIGIAGMSRLNEANVLAMSGRAIEAAGDVDILMLDKTGTITLGNRQAAEFIPVDGVDPAELADAAQLSSLADETPEGRSIVVLAKEQFGLRGRTLEDKGMEFIPFTAATRMSGVNYEGNEIRKGAADSVRTYVEAAGGVFSQECDEAVERIAKAGGTPLVVTKNCRVLGVVYLKDIIKSGVKEKFADLRKMGIKTIMVTGDNPLTAAAIAAEAGVDDFLAEATPEGKLEKIREFQREGHLVAMTGDGVNDAPALKQANIGVAMGITGTEVSKDAASMVLTDDNFATIVKAVENGRNVYKNIKSAIQFLLSGNFAGILAVLYASLANLPVPFAPVHLLFINLLTDSLPAIALGLEPHTKDVMKEKPRPMNESILTKDFLSYIGTEGLVIGIMTMIGFYIGYQESPLLAMTMAFGTLCTSRLVHGFNCKSVRPVLFTKKFFNNIYLIGAFVLGLVLITSVLMIPGLHKIFSVQTLDMAQLFTVYGLSIANLPVIQALKWVRAKLKK